MGRVRLKEDIEKKKRELEDGLLKLNKVGRLPLTADEYKVKIQTLRWVLGDQDSL